MKGERGPGTDQQARKIREGQRAEGGGKGGAEDENSSEKNQGLAEMLEEETKKREKISEDLKEPETSRRMGRWAALAGSGWRARRRHMSHYAKKTKKKRRNPTQLKARAREQDQATAGD